jgi:hypothetical protein
MMIALIKYVETVNSIEKRRPIRSPSRPKNSIPTINPANIEYVFAFWVPSVQLDAASPWQVVPDMGFVPKQVGYAFVQANFTWPVLTVKYPSIKIPMPVNKEAAKYWIKPEIPFSDRGGISFGVEAMGFPVSSVSMSVSYAKITPDPNMIGAYAADSRKLVRTAVAYCCRSSSATPYSSASAILSAVHCVRNTHELEKRDPPSVQS